MIVLLEKVLRFSHWLVAAEWNSLSFHVYVEAAVVVGGDLSSGFFFGLGLGIEAASLNDQEVASCHMDHLHLYGLTGVDTNDPIV